MRDGSDKCIPDGSKYTTGKPEIYRMICLLSEGLFGLPLARDCLEDKVTNFSALMHHLGSAVSRPVSWLVDCLASLQSTCIYTCRDLGTKPFLAL